MADGWRREEEDREGSAAPAMGETVSERQRCYGRDGEQAVALLWERRGANGGVAMGIDRGHREHLATWGLRLLNVLLEG